MDGEQRLHDLRARSRKLRAELEVLSAEIHAQIAENERLKGKFPAAAGDDEEEAV